MMAMERSSRLAVAIDQYAEKALGNCEYFLNKPYSIGGSRKDHVP
jgi:hypothetical protein